MNVIRTPVSVSDITKLLLRCLTLTQRREALSIHTISHHLPGRNPSKKCTCRAVNESFSRDFPNFAFSSSSLARRKVDWIWTGKGWSVLYLHSLQGARQLHTERSLHVGRTGSRLQRRAQNQPDSEQAGKEKKAYRQHRRTKRLPLSQKEEIEQVLEEHADIIAEFAAILGVSDEAVRGTARRDTRLLTQFNKDAVIAKMKLLLDHGFTAAEILSRYQVFSRSMHHLQSGLAAMEEVRHYRYRLATLLLSSPLFKQRINAHRNEVAVMGNHKSQASFMAELLECNQDDITTMATHHNFLLTLPPSRLQAIVRLLQEFGLSADFIRSKCLMLRCPPEVARDRLQRARDAGVLDEELVPYILTNSDTHFEASFATWTRNAEALGDHANEVQLLMHRLHCSEEEVRELMHRNQRLSTMKSAKLQQCLDVLLNEIGLSEDTILQYGSVLYYSPHRLRSRWSLLQPLGLSQSQLTRDLMLNERKFVAKYGHYTH